MKIVAVIAAFGLLLLSQHALAGPREDAQAAFEKGDYATALGMFRPLAAEGDALAQGILGIMYEYGKGVEQDYTEAATWHRLAANSRPRVFAGPPWKSVFQWFWCHAGL